MTDSIQSCTKSNDAASYYHLNWEVYAKKIECPTHLTQVTGCKLAPQGLPAANPNVTTPAQAAADSSFKATAGNGSHYTHDHHAGLLQADLRVAGLGHRQQRRPHRRRAVQLVLQLQSERRSGDGVTVAAAAAFSADASSVKPLSESVAASLM